jgi:hypothetical protein
MTRQDRNHQTSNVELAPDLEPTPAELRHESQAPALHLPTLDWEAPPGLGCGRDARARRA